MRLAIAMALAPFVSVAPATLASALDLSTLSSLFLAAGVGLLLLSPFVAVAEWLSADQAT